MKKQLLTFLVPAIALSFAACSNAPNSTSSDIPSQAVRIGLDGPDFDACAGYGEVSGNRLPVYAAPNLDAKETDRLNSNAPVKMCDYEGDWLGIVYPTSSIEMPECGTHSAIPEVKDYDGPCPSGWVEKSKIKLIAG